MIEEWFDSLAGQNTSQERPNRLWGHWGPNRGADVKISGWSYTAAFSCLPGVHGNDFAYPSCFDRLSRVSPDPPGKKKTMLVLKLGYGRVLYTSHPFRCHAVIRCDVMWLNNGRYTVE